MWCLPVCVDPHGCSMVVIGTTWSARHEQLFSTRADHAALRDEMTSRWSRGLLAWHLCCPVTTLTDRALYAYLRYNMRFHKEEYMQAQKRCSKCGVTSADFS